MENNMVWQRKFVWSCQDTWIGVEQRENGVTLDTEASVMTNTMSKKINSDIMLKFWPKYCFRS